jgi:LysR family glycine cleavage system transcriptional activator
LRFVGYYPKLAEFEKRYPAYKVQMQASTNDDSIRGKAFDVQICYFLNASERVEKHLLKFMDEWLVAVCAPSYLEKNGLDSTTLFSLEQLAKQKLILNEMTGRDWQQWARKLSLGPLPIKHALKFEQDDVAIQAAVAGHGIALANVAYIQREMSLGSLVAATEQAPIVIGAHYLKIAATRRQAKVVDAFCRWLLETENAYT